jgi:hypothetical protein
MDLLLVLLVVVILLGSGGLGYRTWGPMGGGISVGSILVLILVLWLLGVLPRR